MPVCLPISCLAVLSSSYLSVPHKTVCISSSFLTFCPAHVCLSCTSLYVYPAHFWSSVQLMSVFLSSSCPSDCPAHVCQSVSLVDFLSNSSVFLSVCPVRVFPNHVWMSVLPMSDYLSSVHIWYQDRNNLSYLKTQPAHFFTHECSTGFQFNFVRSAY